MSVDSIRQTLEDIAPELTTNEGDGYLRVNRIITIAINETSKTKFGANYDYAVALRAAHMLTLAKRAGVGGPVTSKREGNLSESYGAGGPGLESTSYGQLLKDLIKGRIVGAMIAGQP